MNSKLPEVMHIGYSKCASTFLQAYFENHDDIFLVNQSHFFSPFDMNTFDNGTEFYKEFYDKADADQVLMESDEHILMPLLHPTLMAAGSTIDSIQKISKMIELTQPKVKIIIVIRSQTSLIISRYSEYLLSGGKLKFDEFVTEFLKCSADGINYYENYYYQTLEIFKEKFGNKNILIFLQEELAKDRENVLQKMCDFIGVTFKIPEEKNKSIRSSRFGLSMTAMKVVRLFNVLAIKNQSLAYQHAKARVPYFIYKISINGIRVLDFYLPKLLQGSKNNLLTEDVKIKISNIFKEDNIKLGDSLEKDMRSFGYPC